MFFYFMERSGGDRFPGNQGGGIRVVVATSAPDSLIFAIKFFSLMERSGGGRFPGNQGGGISVVVATSAPASLIFDLMFLLQWSIVVQTGTRSIYGKINLSYNGGYGSDYKKTVAIFSSFFLFVTGYHSCINYNIFWKSSGKKLNYLISGYPVQFFM